MKLDKIKDAIVIWGVPSQEGVDQIKKTHQLVIVPEQRPALIGLHQIVPILQNEGIPFVYCTDNTLGLLFYKQKIAQTFLFYKQCTDAGVVGLNGSLYIALLSALHNVKITTLEGGELSKKIKDQSAATLNGQQMVLAQPPEQFVMLPEDECVGWELLQ